MDKSENGNGDGHDRFDLLELAERMLVDPDGIAGSEIIYENAQVALALAVIDLAKTCRTWVAKGGKFDEGLLAQTQQVLGGMLDGFMGHKPGVTITPPPEIDINGIGICICGHSVLVHVQGTGPCVDCSGTAGCTSFTPSVQLVLTTSGSSDSAP